MKAAPFNLRVATKSVEAERLGLLDKHHQLGDLVNEEALVKANLELFVVIGSEINSARAPDGSATTRNWSTTARITRRRFA